MAGSGATPDPRAQLLRAMLHQQQIGALATLHRGRPAVSMVPFACLAGGDLVIHVSRLATHTGDMLAHPEVALLVMPERAPDVMPQALPRLSFSGLARPCAQGDDRHGAARQAYLARFAEVEPIFAFADFSLFVIEPQSVRGVGGFAQAWTLTADQYRQALAA